MELAKKKWASDVATRRETRDDNDGTRDKCMMVKNKMHVWWWWRLRCTCDDGEDWNARVMMVKTERHVWCWWRMRCTCDDGEDWNARVMMVKNEMHVWWWPRGWRNKMYLRSKMKSWSSIEYWSHRGAVSNNKSF